MTIDGSFRLGSFDAVRGLKYGVAELPAGPDGTRSNYASYWVNAITTKAQGEKLEASKKFLAFLTSPEAMQIWLETVGELPARRSVALSDKNIANPVYAPFIKGLDYAHTTLFVDEAAERQVSMDMVNRVVLQNQPVDAALAEAAKAEQEILDRYYQKK
jgi:multiple sugar transport system substrate-binding protein